MPKTTVNFNNVVFYKIVCIDLDIKNVMLDILLILQTERASIEELVRMKSILITINIYIDI